MKLPIGKISIVFIISMALGYTGMLFYGNLVNLILPRHPNVQYQDGSFSYGFNMSLALGLLLALLPVICILIWKFGRIERVKKQVLVPVIIFGSMITSIFLWRYWMDSKIEAVVSNPLTRSRELLIPLDDTKIELFVLEGCVTGILLAFLYLRQKKVILQPEKSQEQ